MKEPRFIPDVWIKFSDDSTLEERFTGFKEIERVINRGKKTPNSSYGRNTFTMIERYRANTNLYTGIYVPAPAAKVLENEFYNPIVASWIRKMKNKEKNITPESAPVHYITKDELKKVITFGEAFVTAGNFTLRILE